MTDPSIFSFPPRAQAPIAIQHVTVVPMDSERQVPGQTVIIENGRIKSIGPAGNYDTKAMSVVDGAGKYLLPGLADMHVHYWMPGDTALFLSHGITLVRNMSGAPFHLALQQKVERREAPGPRIVTTSPIIDADNFMFPTLKALQSPSAAQALISRYAARGYQQIKVLNSIDLEVLRVLGSACKEYDLRLTGHCPLVVSYEEAIELGMTSFEHLVGIWRGHYQHGIAPEGNTNLSIDVVEAVANHLDFEAVRRLAADMAEQEIWNCPTLVADQLMQLPFAEGMENVVVQPFLKYVPKSVFPLWEVLDSNRRYAQETEMLKRWRNAIRGRAKALAQVTKILHEEGAPLLIGTDTSVRFVIQGISVHQELENFIRIGISPYEALRSATSEPARFLRQSHEFGTVAKGKRADLILVDANPFVDIGMLKRPLGVFINGYYLSREILDGLLDKQVEFAGRNPVDILPPKRNENVQDTGQLVGSGNWDEFSGEAVVGKLRYHHWLLSNGGWQIDEQHAFEQNSILDIGGARLSSTNLLLNPDFTLCSGTVTEESFAGISRIQFSMTDGKRLTVKQVSEDGFVEEYEFLGDGLLPGPSLSLSMPVLRPFRKLLEASDDRRLICLLAGIEFERMEACHSVIALNLAMESTADDLTIQSECPEYRAISVHQFGDDGLLKNCEYGRKRFVPVHR